MSTVKSNIWKLYVIKALQRFMIIMPIIVLFFQNNGLSMKQVLLLQSIFSVGIIVFEIPSGYFSDVIGRKKTIIIACILSFLGMLTYSLGSGFGWFLLAELTMGLGASFLSGTDSALLYDTLLDDNKEGDYKKLEGRMSSVGNFSEAIAGFIGGFVALISLRMPFFIYTGLMFLAIIVALTLVEPHRHKNDNKEGALKGVIKIVKYALHHNTEIKRLIFYGGFIGASTLTMVWLAQPYLQLVKLPLAYFGIVWGILNLSVGIFSWYAHKIEMSLGRKTSLISFIFIIFAAYILLGVFHSLWAIPFMLLFYLVRGVNGPVISDYVNKMISSDMRATVLSVKQLVTRLIFALVGPFIGWVTDFYSLQTALLASGTIFFVFGIITLFFLWKHKAL